MSKEGPNHEELESKRKALRYFSLLFRPSEIVVNISESATNGNFLPSEILLKRATTATMIVQTPPAIGPTAI